MVRTLATPLEGRGSPKKFSRTGVRTPKRTNQSGAGFGNPAPGLETGPNDKIQTIPNSSCCQLVSHHISFNSERFEIPAPVRNSGAGLPESGAGF